MITTIQEDFSLPSKGLMYTTKFDPHIKLRSMTVADEMKRLQATERPYKVMTEIIDDCLSKMSERCYEILTKFYDEEKKLDQIMLELNTFKSKDALKTAKNKCLDKLRTSSVNIYNQRRNSKYGY